MRTRFPSLNGSSPSKIMKHKEPPRMRVCRRNWEQNWTPVTDYKITAFKMYREIKEGVKHMSERLCFWSRQRRPSLSSARSATQIPAASKPRKTLGRRVRGAEGHAEWQGSVLGVPFLPPTDLPHGALEKPADKLLTGTDKSPKKISSLRTGKGRSIRMQSRFDNTSAASARHQRENRPPPRVSVLGAMVEGAWCDGRVPY